MEPRKFIDFIITQKCTYKCPYCSQSKLQACNPKNASKETIHAFYRLLDSLDKDFEITITGGEALLHPDFFEIIETVKAKGFKINLITNLSSNIKMYDKIFEVLEDSLNEFDISFHLNQIRDFNLTLEKARKIIDNIPKSTKLNFFIPLYLIDKKSTAKIEKILKLANEFNIDYEFQKIRFLDKYKKEQSEKYLPKYNMQKTFSKLCFAGCKSAVIYENGNAYRCYSSRFSSSNFLGNIKNEDFSLLSCPKPCTHLKCGCPKPFKYNQIKEEKNFKLALKNAVADCFLLPKVAIKNMDIVKIKFKQLFNLNS